MINYSAAYKYETPYKGPFVITQYFTNGTVMLQYGAIHITYNINVALSHLNLILKLIILIRKIWMMLSTYELPVIYFYIKLNIGIKYMIGDTRRNLTLIYIVRVREVLHDGVVFSQRMHF